MPPITSWTIYNTNYCTHYQTFDPPLAWALCDQRVTIQSMSKTDYKELGTSIFFNGWIMVAMIFVVLYILKIIFSKFFW